MERDNRGGSPKSPSHFTKPMSIRIDSDENMRLSFPFRLVLLFLLLPLPCPIETLSNSITGCPQKCGDVEVPYPFGIGPGCSLPGFEVFCTQTEPAAPFLPRTNLKILNISNGEVRIDSTPFVASDCADHNHTVAQISLPEDSPFTLSDNSFMAVGCDTVAVVTDDGTFTSGCVSLCSSRESVSSGSCSGAGCCETAIPKGQRYLGMAISSMFGYANVSSFNNCSYSFLVERGGLIFTEADLTDFPRGRSIAMRLEWDLGNHGCFNTSSGSCGKNGYCAPSARGSGYICNCSHGYAGNPYLNGSRGCQDVDECLDQEHNPCLPIARCRNKVPGYRCQCPFGSTGDGTRLGSGCRRIYEIIEAVLGTCLGFGIVLLSGLWFYCALKKRALIKLKELYFRQNGGWLLKQQVSTREGGADYARMFSSEELRQATQGFDNSKIIGTGGFGTVYKGTLEDGTVVAIKKSKVMDQNQIDQFINEVVILTQINHRNVVKLLGCCLETEVPMLVYEFISNGTLHKHIHENQTTNRIAWRDRLRIALETAEALAYLHSAASMPIFHRDVKSSNILLDENYTAKVSDFGISRLVPLDQSQVPTLVQGTLGYLDPEYFQTSQLTSKSDVYSFGVVLVELLTGQKPVSLDGSRENCNLAMYFLSSLKSKELGEFIESDVLREGSFEQLGAVAELARKCLLLRGDERPAMKEVAQELVAIAGYGKHGGVENEEGGDNHGTFKSQDSLTSNLSVTLDLAR